jgi:hypothetical protein
MAGKKAIHTSIYLTIATVFLLLSGSLVELTPVQAICGPYRLHLEILRFRPSSNLVLFVT